MLSPDLGEGKQSHMDPTLARAPQRGYHIISRTFICVVYLNISAHAQSVYCFLTSPNASNWTSMYPCCASFGFHFNIIHCYEHKVCSVLLKSRADRPKAGLSGENFIPVCWWKPWWNLPRDLNFKGGGLRILVGLFSRPFSGLFRPITGAKAAITWIAPSCNHRTLPILQSYELDLFCWVDA